ncbi:MAG TPA: translation elongation factor Ts [bacterium]|nr:translation elongation factor Ts [bacterium]
MTEISAEKVRELRDKTGAGMMDCKRALAATAGDMEKAVDHLRKEGVVKAAKKAGRATSEGLIGVSVSPDKKTAALAEVNCETDFVARTDQFQNFLNALSEHIVKNKPSDVDALLAQKMGGASVQDVLAQLVAKLGENMGIRRFRIVQAGPGEVLAAYLHAGAKIGSIIRVKGGAAEELVRDVAMHAAAMSPRYLDRTQVPADALNREKDVLKASPELNGKPDNIVEKILTGKLNRFYSENCLTDQPFIKDTSGKKSVADFLKEQGAGSQVAEMVRFQVGEETTA